MTRIGAFEAKTHLPELLQRVQARESIAIMRHGQEVARLVPPLGRSTTPDIGAVIPNWKQLRKGVKLRGLKVR